MSPSQAVWGEEEEEGHCSSPLSLVSVPLRGGEGRDLAQVVLMEMGLCCLTDQTSSLSKIHLPVGAALHWPHPCVRHVWEPDSLRIQKASHDLPGVDL